MRVFTIAIAPPVTIGIKSASQDNSLMSRFPRLKKGSTAWLTPSADQGWLCMSVLTSSQTEPELEL